MAATSGSAGGPTGGKIWFAHAVRGPAAALVVAEHLLNQYPNDRTGVAIVGRFSPSPKRILVPWHIVYHWFDVIGISPGQVAVGLFLLVSGFVIPLSLKRLSVPVFTARRLLRIYPTLAVGLFVAVVALKLNETRLGGTPVDGRGLLGANVTLLAPYFRVSWIDPVLWTIACEEIFYVCAACLAWRRWLSNPYAILAVGALATALTWSPVSIGSGRYWFYVYLAFQPCIHIGLTMHNVYSKKWSPRLGLTVGSVQFALFVLGLHAKPNRYQATTYTRSAAVALLLFVGLWLLGPRLRYNRFVDWLSNMSYPIYLLHGTNGYLLLHYLELHGVSYFVGLPIVLVVTILAAVVLHRFVELPSIALGKRLGTRIGSGRGVGGHHDTRTTT